MPKVFEHNDRNRQDGEISIHDIKNEREGRLLWGAPNPVDLVCEIEEVVVYKDTCASEGVSKKTWYTGLMHSLSATMMMYCV